MTRAEIHAHCRELLKGDIEPHHERCRCGECVATARPNIDLAAALLEAANAALHVTPGQQLDASFLRTLGNTLASYAMWQQAEPWAVAMVRLRDAASAYAAAHAEAHDSLFPSECSF